MDLDIDMQRVRLRNASTITLLMVFLLLGLVVMSSNSGRHGFDTSQPAKAVSISDLAQQTVFGSSDLDHTLENHGFEMRNPDELNAWFSDEVMDPVLIKSCLSNSESALFNIEFFGDGAVIRPQIKDALKRKGWNVMEEGDVLTCVKNRGYCRWMMIEYQDGEDGLSAVLRILHS